MGNIFSVRILRVIFNFIGLFYLLSLSLYAEDLLDKEYIIGPEDILEIKVWDNEDLNSIVEVSQEGTFTFLLIGRVQASGRSVFELEDIIEKKLADGYLVSPQVTITVKEYNSRKVFVLGEVNKPGSYPLKGNTHILGLISQAGGVTASAGQTVTIVRPRSLRQSGKIGSREDKENEIITLDLGDFDANSKHDTFVVANGDSIYINRAPRVFVIGEVQSPGELKWERGLTIRQAISIAGGSTEKASPKRVIVIRTKNGVEKELKPKMDEFVLPGDIIKVPGRYF